MSGERLDEAKKAAINFISPRDLSSDYINIITFNTDSSYITNSNQSLPTMINSINRLTSEGGTNLTKALQTVESHQKPSEIDQENVLVFTDGQPNS